MKLHVIAAAAASLFSAGAVMADNTAQLYGDFRMSLAHNDQDGGAPRDLSLQNNNSHLGVKASSTAGNMKVTLQYERDLDNDDTTASGSGVDLTRIAMLSVETAYGTLGYGIAPTAYKTAGQKLDPFYNTSVSGINGSVGGNSGAGYGLSALTNDSNGSGFIENQVAYTSPSFGGLTVNAALFLGEGAGNPEDNDYGFGAQWTGGNITLGVQALDLNSGVAVGSTQNFNAIGLAAGAGAELNSVRGYASYNGGGWGVGASGERLDLKNGAKDRDYAFVSGWFGLTEKCRLAISAGATDNTPFEGDSVTLGLLHDFAPNFSGYVAARSTHRKTSSTLNSDTEAFAAGVSYRFGLGGKV